MKGGIKGLSGVFSKDVKSLMFGFGDVSNPAEDSVALLEEMLIMEWIEISQRVSNLVEGKVKTQDFLHGLKNDTKKLARAKQLLLLEKEISKVKKIYNINDEAEI